MEIKTVLCCLLANMCFKCAIFVRENECEENEERKGRFSASLRIKKKAFSVSSQLLEQVFLVIIDRNVDSSRFV